jgi:hypothetical protein
VEVEALELGLARAAGGDVTEVLVSFPSAGVLSPLAPCAKWLLSGGRHNRTSDGLLLMWCAVAGVDSIMSRPP